MKLGVFLNYDGNCNEAIEFYSGVFKAKPTNFMKFGDMPQGPHSDSDSKDRVLHAEIAIGTQVLMFSDTPCGVNVEKGQNVCIVLTSDDKLEVERVYQELSKDAINIRMPLGKTFFSEAFAYFTDKLGTNWQISLNKSDRAVK